MNLYPNIFAYLNRDITVANHLGLNGRDRPILVLEDRELMSGHPLLIERDRLVYEIAFPYLKLAERQHHDFSRQFEFTLDLNHQSQYLQVTDEVFDEGAIEEEKQLEEFKNSQWSDFLDNSIGLLLQVYIGIFEGKDLGLDRNSGKISLHQLPEYLQNFNVVDATLPLVISLEKRYELIRKLREISPKLRHQLRRKAELMPIGRIQEMDSYCLRDYTRRPGGSPEEKGGSRQELMGVKRYQDYNTTENKFLVYFVKKILHLECFRVEQSGAKSHIVSLKKIRQAIDSFQQVSQVQTISSQYFRLTKPNYILLQNPIYNSFIELI